MIYIKSQRFPYPLVAVFLALSLSGCLVENMGPLTVNQATGQEQDCGSLVNSPNQTCEAPGSSNDDTETESSITVGNAASAINSALQKIELTYNFGYAGGTLLNGVDTETSSGSLASFFRDVLTQLNQSVTQYGLPPTILGALTDTPPSLTCENDGRTEEPTSLGDGTLRFDVGIDPEPPCTINDVTFQGTFSISEINIAGDWAVPTPTWSLGALFSFDQFTVTIAGGPSTGLTGAFRYNAGYDVNAPAEDPQETGTIIVTNPVGITIGTQTDTLNTDFGIQYGYDYRTSTLTLDAFGSFSGSNAGGVLQVSTGANNVPLTQGDGDGINYHDGILLVTASDGTSAQLQVLNSSDVQINVNDDSNPIPLSWDDLRSS